MLIASFFCSKKELRCQTVAKYSFSAFWRTKWITWRISLALSHKTLTSASGRGVHFIRDSIWPSNSLYCTSSLSPAISLCYSIRCSRAEATKELVTTKSMRIVDRTFRASKLQEMALQRLSLAILRVLAIKSRIPWRRSSHKCCHRTSLCYKSCYKLVQTSSRGV